MNYALFVPGTMAFRSRTPEGRLVAAFLFRLNELD